MPVKLVRCIHSEDNFSGLSGRGGLMETIVFDDDHVPEHTLKKEQMSPGLHWVRQRLCGCLIHMYL